MIASIAFNLFVIAASTCGIVIAAILIVAWFGCRQEKIDNGDWRK